MNEQIGTLEVTYVPQSPELDPITVFWQNFELGKGIVTLTCYGDAWTAWFGAMGNRTIQQFVDSAGVDYLVNKLSPNHVRLNQTQTKRQDQYLARIVKALKAEMSKPS
jgi:hypothetical protein